MKTVEIINGAYGHRPAPGKPTRTIRVGKTVDLPDAEADRLVNLKVAKYVIPAPAEETPPAGVATPPAGTSGGATGNDFPDDKYGTDGQEAGAEGNGGDDEQGDLVLDIEDGHFTKESLMKLTRGNMEQMAADLGIEAETVKACKNKGELADLIAAVEIAGEDEGDGEQPPVMGAESPVM